MRTSTLRLLSRQQLSFGSRRAASTSAESAVKAKEQAAQAFNKAIEFLSKSGDSFAKLAAKTGGRTGKVLKAVESAIPPTVYYSKVAIELSKIVFRGQNMTPPISTFQTAFKSVTPATTTAFFRSTVQNFRSFSTKDLVFAGVLGAEVIGFFTVGEIIGRRKLIGYRGEVAHAGH